ncbi:MAG: CDP-glycerol glycerophosphotransferase family protein [Erysipelotrichaceae bacterium]|nr:CDP-glycerol glycerophosphotransferase family protein [Erysipelotrichaceae bacterium]
MTLKSEIKKQLQLLRLLDCRLLYEHYCRQEPVNPRQILMTSLSRSSLSGNLYYIDQQLKGTDYEVKYAFYHKKTLSWSEKKELCRLLATSAFVLIDDVYYIVYGIPFRKETKLIQVWHALGAFKRVGAAIEGKQDAMPVTHRNYDATVVSSQGIVDDYARAFDIDRQKVLPLGVARTDVFFSQDYRTSVRQRLYEKYPQLAGKKVILFAPTFRQKGRGAQYYDFDRIDLERLQQLGDDYRCIIKLHPFITNTYRGCKSNFFLDLTGEREINDLLFITDYLITDYSSVIFEGALLKVKTIFYAYDLEEYASGRSFFYPFETYAIGPVVRNEDDLLACIRNYRRDETRFEEFYQKFMGACDGHSAERFVRTVIQGGLHDNT